MGQIKYGISDLVDKALIRQGMMRWFKKCLVASELNSLMAMNMEQRH